MRPLMTVFDTVTATLAAVAMFPAPSRARADSVWGPLGAPDVFQLKVYVDPGPVTSAPRFAPSSRNCTPATPTLSDAEAVMVTVPFTVAPVAGTVTATEGAIVSSATV